MDFCAVSDHVFQITRRMWARSKAVTNRMNRPGEFVTFNAYEWSGVPEDGGDTHQYCQYPECDSYSFHALSFAELINPSTCA